MTRLPAGLLLLAVVSVLAAPAAEAVELAGRGSIGGSGGIMLFTSGEDFGDGNQLRLIGQVGFKYNFTRNWAGVIESGFGWNAYPDDRVDHDTLATVIPTTFGAQYRFQTKGNIWPVLGAGLGFYSLGVKDTWRSWANANQGTERLTWTSPGFYLKAGAEYIFASGTSINVDTLFHNIFSEDTERFPDMWGNQNTSFWQLRVGLSYYFKLPGAGAGPDLGDGG